MRNKLSLRVSTKSSVADVKLLTSKAGYLNAKSASNKHKARRQIIKNAAIYKVTGRTRQKTREYIYQWKPSPSRGVGASRFCPRATNKNKITPTDTSVRCASTWAEAAAPVAGGGELWGRPSQGRAARRGPASRLIEGGAQPRRRLCSFMDLR
jgi:hypothetical protein